MAGTAYPGQNYPGQYWWGRGLVKALVDVVRRSTGKLGEKSTPFIAAVRDYNSSAKSHEDVSLGYFLGDLFDLIFDLGTTHYIGLVRPIFAGKFASAFFQMRFKSNAGEGSREMRIAFIPEGDVVNEATLDRHSAIMGGPWPFGADEVVEVNRDVLRLITDIVNVDSPDPTFQIVIDFDAVPSEWQEFTKFKLICGGDLIK